MILVFLFLLTSVSLSAMEEITRGMTITSGHEKNQPILVTVEEHILTGHSNYKNYFLVNANETVCCEKNKSSSHPTIYITYTEPPFGYNKTLRKNENGNVYISATKTVVRLYQKDCSPNENDEKNKEQDYEKYLNFFIIIQNEQKKHDLKLKKRLLSSKNYAKNIV